jgi:hypothetical protein
MKCRKRRSGKMMKLPYWLLRLFPLFDYICPRCRREVKKKSHKCPYCGENYGVPLCVPPKVFKDSKALEEYVHKHVFPKVSAWQREYLAKYFTIIFQSGFETGDFSEWTGTEGAPTIVAAPAPVHHGSYAALCNSESRIYKTFSAQNVVYFRFYVQTSGVPTSSGEWIHIATVWAGTSESIQIRIQHDGTSAKFALRNYNAGILVYGTTTVQPNTWYCIEVKAHNSGYGTGDILYVNGVQEATDRTSYGAYGALTEVDVKQYTEYGYKNIYFDCCVVADTGPIGSEPGIPKGRITVHAKVGG